jgi:hypothetical protein
MTEAEKQFTEWLCREIPKDTIIGNPSWWAPHIWNAVLRAQAAATPEPVAMQRQKLTAFREERKP